MECERHVEQALELSSRLLDLANEVREACDHDGCLLLDGIVRDCALRIKREALRSGLELGRVRASKGAAEVTHDSALSHSTDPNTNCNTFKEESR